MKRRNADCGKIRRPIKKNKIAEQIGSNTLLYVKFLLLWASVITADFLLEFRFEFLWPFWLLLRSVYDSFKYKGLAFSVLFVCIAITSDLVCLFFIPVQWLFFAASTYVWVQYVWHTDKGICLPTIILWILFVYLEAAIRWKDSRNIPHLDLCRPFAAHCIGYPVVTLGFGFKSYVGYCIRQRKQREVAKDNDFYMQLLQEALPKDESTLLDQVPGDGSSGTGSEQQLQKDLIVVTATTTSITASAVSMSGTLLNSMNTSSSSTSSSSRSDAGQNHHHHHPHNHHNQHHHNHQQQQQQQQPNTHSKSAQNHKSPSNSTVSTSHVNGHVSSGSSPSVNTSAMNGGLNHQPSSGQGSSKHRKSLDKDSSSTSSSASSTSNGSVKGSNGGAGGGSGNFSYHQAIATFPQSNGATGSTASSVAATVTASSTKETSVSGAPQRGNDHGSNHVTSGPTVKDTKESPSAASVGQNRKDSDKEATGSSVTTSPTGVRSANGVANRSKSPADGPSPCTGKAVGKQVNGHVPNLEPAQVQPPNAATANGLNGESSPVTVPVMEAKSSRSGRKNRLKQQQKAADQANISTIAKIFATLGLASTVTTLTTATTSTASGSSTTNSANFGGTTSTTDCGAVPGSKDGREDGAGGVPSGHESSASARGASGNTQQSTPDAGDAAQPKPPANGPPVPSAPTVVMVQKACETCPRLEGDLKKVRAEVAAHRQAENELRQKYDTTASNLKGCLQAKQKDCDELQSRYQELSSQRQQERQSLQTVERRLGEERRLRQSLESQLGNERKHRKLAEERVSRGECSEACMAKKRQMQLELEKLKHELLSSEESKHLAEKQTRSFEQEMRKFEVQLRNRESQQNTDVLMSALAAMQDKNATLEKSLSAETRVKLDLFSALGGARREVDILTCSLRSKENEILDLNAKIVELVAVMPTMPDDTLCLTGPVGSGTGQDGGPSASMMRLPDAPQLLPQPLSGGLNGVGGAGSGGTGQQPSPMSHMVLNGQPLIGQLGGGLGVLTSTMTTVSSSNSVCPPPGVTLASLASGAGSGGGSVGQLVQMQSTNQGNGNCPSGLDPNATVYTPKNNGMVGGTEA